MPVKNQSIEDSKGKTFTVKPPKKKKRTPEKPKTGEPR